MKSIAVKSREAKEAHELVARETHAEVVCKHYP